MNHIAVRMYGAARLMLNPERLIDKFLDWIDEQRSIALVEVAQPGGLATRDIAAGRSGSYGFHVDSEAVHRIY